MDFLRSEIEDIDVNVEEMRLFMAALEGIEKRHPRLPGAATVLNVEEIQEFLRVKREETSPSLDGSLCSDDVPSDGPPHPAWRSSRSPTHLSSTGLHGPTQGLNLCHTLATLAGQQDNLTDVSSTGLTPPPPLVRRPRLQVDPIPAVNPSLHLPRARPLTTPRAHYSSSSTLTDSSQSSPVVASMPYPQPVPSSRSHISASHPPVRPRPGPASKTQTYPKPINVSAASATAHQDPSASTNPGRHITRSMNRLPPRVSSSRLPIVNLAFVQVPPAPFSGLQSLAGHPRTAPSSALFDPPDIIDLTMPPPVIDLRSPGFPTSSPARASYVSSPLSSVPEVLN